MKPTTRILVSCAGLLLLGGCNNSTRSRPPVEIVQERQSLPALFLTEKTKQRVIAPGDKLMHVDPATKELSWPARECSNPDCPGRADGKPFLFTKPLDYGYYAKEDNTVGYDPAKSRSTPPYHGCPECAKIRNLGKETPEEKARYNGFDKLHELPESARRRAQLDEELKRAMEIDPARK